MAEDKSFRDLWRTNAFLVTFAVVAIAILVGYFVLADFGWKSARDREADAGVQIAPADSKDKLTLGTAEVVAGSAVLRADLFVSRDGGFSSSGSGGYSETRNVLFIDPADKAAHWLLPDNDHVVVSTLDIEDEKDPNAKRVIATAFFVKPLSEKSEATSGRLILADSAGSKVVEVSNDVKDVQVAALNAGEVILLFERNRRLVSTAFDPNSLAKKREQEIDIPQLK
jgi:hypothetical protein